MGVFIQLIDSVEEKKLYGYSLFSTSLALLFLGIYILLKKEWSTHSGTKFPIVGIESPGYIGILKARLSFVANGYKIVRNAYYKYPGKNFVVTTYSYDKVVLTHDQVKELSNAPDDTISISHAAVETMMGDYTGLDQFVGTTFVEDVVRIKLTQNLGSMNEAMLEEARFALNTELPECTTDEWRSVEVFATIIRIVARMSARAFVGFPLCRNEDWLTITMVFTGHVFMTHSKLACVPKPIRPIYSYVRNLVKDIAEDKRKAESLLAPVIRKRLEEESLAKKNGTVFQKPNDMLQWLSDRVDQKHKTTKGLSELQLVLSLAAIHTTSISFLNAIFDLLAHPECIQPIREEMEAIISANNGVLDRVALRKMKKTDSFFKESMRGKIGLFSFNRKVLKSVTLSDGTYLPKGTLITAPTSMFSSDPDFVEDPETFDGFRWYKKSLEAEGNNNYWATTSSNDLAFGHGKHACPGRFFATERMKTILIFILLQYDIKYPEGESRPENIDHGEFSYPDTTKQLLFKKLPGPKKYSFF
ncbi:unnamed protein product [Tuber melanosporum]|uniref:(Perigord truffle) hypothetical protein n=1 Tax=Tuber melanosporum (strain Mel28) TaxID=656061 RepID=D5GH19_TUBMM|nr:uncharacterized protein GSTUM_00007658001 [Tuber melanosporum]CAZ83812.1 unnamed protein product [Tuber melanosporum]